MRPDHFERLVNGAQIQDGRHLLEVWDGVLDVPRSCEQTMKLRGSTLAGPKTGRKRLALQAAAVFWVRSGHILSLFFEAGRIQFGLSTATSVSSTRPPEVPQPTFSFRGCDVVLDLHYERPIFKGRRTLEEALLRALRGCVVILPSRQLTLEAWF